jgi:hypothetical protein
VKDDKTGKKLPKEIQKDKNRKFLEVGMYSKGSGHILLNLLFVI